MAITYHESFNNLTPVKAAMTFRLDDLLDYVAAARADAEQERANPYRNLDNDPGPFAAAERLAMARNVIWVAEYRQQQCAQAEEALRIYKCLSTDGTIALDLERDPVEQLAAQLPRLKPKCPALRQCQPHQP